MRKDVNILFSRLFLISKKKSAKHTYKKRKTLELRLRRINQPYNNDKRFSNSIISIICGALQKKQTTKLILRCCTIVCAKLSRHANKRDFNTVQDRHPGQHDCSKVAPFQRYLSYHQQPIPLQRRKINEKAKWSKCAQDALSATQRLH